MVSFQVLATFVKNAFYLPDIFQLHKYLKLFLLMYRIYVNGNKAIENSGYINIWFTKSGPRKVLLRNYQYFYFSNINMSFTNFFFKKMPVFYEILKLLLKFVSQIFSTWYTKKPSLYAYYF